MGSTGTAVMPLAAVTASATSPAVGARAATPGATGRGGRTALLMLAGALVVAALLGLGVALLGDDPEPSGQETPATSSTPSASATRTTAPPISVVAAELVGRPVADVQAELVALGLAVTLAPVETADVPPGQVTAVEPVGDLAPGAAVTVAYAVPPVVVPTPQPPAPDTGEEGNGNGNGNGDEGGGNGKEGNEGKGNDKKDEDEDKDD